MDREFIIDYRNKNPVTSKATHDEYVDKLLEAGKITQEEANEFKARQSVFQCIADYSLENFDQKEKTK